MKHTFHIKNMYHSMFPLPDTLLNIMYKPSDIYKLGTGTTNFIEMPSNVRVISTILTNHGKEL